MVLEKMMVDERLLGREEGLKEGKAAGLAEGRTSGLAEGRASGIRDGIHSSITMLRSLHLTDAEIVDKITETFHLTKEQAEKYVMNSEFPHQNWA